MDNSILYTCIAFATNSVQFYGVIYGFRWTNACCCANWRWNRRRSV